MNVVPFIRRDGEIPGLWQRFEMQRVADAVAEPLTRGEVSGWEAGLTEAGDPQLYLLGPAPERECLVCLTRLGRLYVMEDGQGRILFEHDAIGVLAEQMRGALRQKKAAIVARIAVAWIAVRETFEERVEAALAEPIELFSLIAPGLV
ncbi:MAG: hypothetical protein Q7T81_07040 [Pseudolabrys sp.]|nr:hypothetical protein [Pseudolabrys sp.]